MNSAGLPAIVAAAQAETVCNAALAYHKIGLNVFPVCGKKPAEIAPGKMIPWKTYQHTRTTEIQISLWEQRGLLKGIAVIGGAVSGNLVIIDLDGLAAVDRFRRQFPALTETFTVASGSGRGQHLYLYADRLPPSIFAFSKTSGNIEVRASGCYVVAPPSPHPSGSRYTVAKPVDILRVPDLMEVVTWLRTLKDEPRTTLKRPSKRTMGGGWAARALSYECRDVGLAAEGSRNDRLNTAAYNIGQIVGDGLLSRGEVEAALLAAATRAGLPETEATATIRSGLDAGIREPRSTQWTKRGQQR